MTLRGKIDDNWELFIQPCIQLWNNRRCSVVSGPPQQGLLNANSEYMRWYTSRTRRWISRTGAHEGQTVHLLIQTYDIVLFQIKSHNMDVLISIYYFHCRLMQLKGHIIWRPHNYMARIPRKSEMGWKTLCSCIKKKED